MSEWRSFESAPKDGSYVLAKVTGASERWEHWNGRSFVICHEGQTSSGYDLGWAVFPGFGGVADDWFSLWAPLPDALSLPTGEDDVERVARAAYLAHRPRNKGWLTLSLYQRQQWLASARAAIAAMHPE